MVTSVGNPCWSYEVVTSGEADGEAEDKAAEEDGDGSGELELD